MAYEDPKVLDPQVVALAKAIRQVETGGSYNAKGGSGEGGAFQFMPATWKSYATKYLNDANAPMTGENQNKVTYFRIKEWKDAGYNPAQIASLWNHGSADWRGVVGVNDQGVSFNTPAYVQKVFAAYQQFKPQTGTPTMTTNANGQTSAVADANTGPLGATKLGKYNISNPEMGMNVAGKAADLANTAYQKFTQAPGVKQFSQGVGLAVGTAGGIIGGTVGALGETGIQTVKAIQGKGFDPRQIVKSTVDTAKSTASFGYKTGETGAPAAILGEFGGFVPNAVAAYGTGVQGARDITQGVQQKDPVQVTRGLTELVPTALGVRGTIREAGAGGNPMVSENFGQAKEAVIGKAKEINPKLGAVTEAVVSPLKTYKNATAESRADKAMDVGINKGIRPSVAGKQTASQSKAYMGKAKTAVELIVEHKENLSLTDEAGRRVPLPENLKQFSESIEQTKKTIFQKYDALAKSAGDKGATVSMEPAVAELEVVANSKVLKTHAPGVAEYAQSRAEALKGSGNHTTVEAQEAIALYNRSLEAFYKNPSYDTASRAYIDSLIVNKLREGLDSAIENVGGEGYQELKNQYGALKSIEKDVNHRAIVNARKNVKGLIDFTDVATGAELLHGILSMSPSSALTAATVKGISTYVKYMNDPNVMIKKMFSAVNEAKQATPLNVKSGGR